MGAAAAAAGAGVYERKVEKASLSNLMLNGPRWGVIRTCYLQCPEFKFKFIFFHLQMLRFSAFCGPNEQKFGELLT